jgi:Leucine-rich repeat (LRR) protein
MVHLDGLKHLKLLCLTRSRVGDDGMRSIAGHASLQRLHVPGIVTRRGLAELVRLTSLEELKIDRRLTDEDLAVVGQMTNLTSLRCDLSRVTDEGLRHMKNMTRLRLLYLGMTEATTDAGMAYVAQMSGLESLTPSRGIGDAGLARLSALPNLKDLNLQATKITDAGLVKLTGLRQLHRLNLIQTQVTAAGVAQLRGMKSLERIDLNYTDVSLEDIEKLKDSGVPASKTGGSYHGWMKR